VLTLIVVIAVISKLSPFLSNVKNRNVAFITKSQSKPSDTDVDPTRDWSSSRHPARVLWATLTHVGYEHSFKVGTI